MPLFERICLSGLDMSGSRNRYLASFLKGQISRIGGSEGPGTYRVLSTHSCDEAKWTSSNFDPGAPDLGENKSFWLVSITCFVKFAIIHIVDRVIHEDRSVFSEKYAILGFHEHIRPHAIYRERSVSWAVNDINITLINFVLDKKVSIPDMFHSSSCRKTTISL